MFAHLGNARHQIKRIESGLHIIVVVFNPLRFLSRYNLFTDFKKHAEDAGAHVWVVELAFGERPFEVSHAGHPRNIQFRTEAELWHKEAMINEAVSRLPADWKYVAWVDADVTFVNPDWVHETVQQLQHYQIVQMFTHAIDLGPQGEPIENFRSFAYSYLLNEISAPKIGGKPGAYYGKYWHPGFAWAYRRHAWDTLGGMLDINIVGGGDHQMAYGLIGRIAETIPDHSGDNYREMILDWEANAKLLARNIGAVPSTLIHHWHGRKKQRGYFDRWKILTENNYDPLADIRRDWQRMFVLTGNKIKLRDDLRAYFRQRNEDGVEV